jgi:DNA ligase-associated metallophosphoesterase
VHLGKAAAFRAAGVPVPAGSTETTLGMLSLALGNTSAIRLVFLGDLWHAAAGRTAATTAAFEAWRCRHPSVRMTLVEGNHDRRSGRLPPEWGVEEVEEGSRHAPFVLAHYPGEDSGGYVLCGHLHPAARLEGLGGQSIQLPCFWLRERYAVLPAFGDFTGCAAIRATAGDRVYLIAQNRVIAAKAELSARNGR